MTTANYFLKLVEKVLSGLKQELSCEKSARLSGEDDSVLQSMIAKVELIKSNYNNNKLPPKGTRQLGLGRIVVDQWPLNSQLGGEICELERTYKNL